MSSKVRSSIISNDLYSYMDEASIHDLLKCKICFKPFVNPVSTQNGDRCCRSCISRILRREHSSENTNNDHQQSKMQSLTPVTERLVLEMLDTLLVRCTKCGQINIKRGELIEHENQSCLQATVLCSAADIKCKWMGPRDKLAEHRDQCKFEPLRSALEDVFNQHDQFKTRLQNLTTQINELRGIRMIEDIDINL